MIVTLVDRCVRARAMIWWQHWTDVLFLHFPVAVSELERLVPPRVEVDMFAGQAWISFVLFRLKLRPGWLPPVPGFSSLVELNLRTYVRHRDQPGICFLRMYADNRWAIRAANLLTPLHYRHAWFNYQPAVAGWRQVECQATDDPGRRLALLFQPSGPIAAAEPGSLDAWLLERYRLFVHRQDGGVIAADVEHSPWQTSGTTAIVSENTIAEELRLSLPKTPAAIHFSPGLGAQFQEFRVVAAPPSFNACGVPLPARATDRCGGR
jgi:uncharacterized protein